MSTLAGVKINLCLRVGPKRPDGYHELATVLAALPLGDSVELEPAAVTSVEAPGLPGGDGLATRALGLLADHAGHGAGWRVHIDKRAPVGAGIGGGSADAGVALRLANATLPQPLAPADLLALAAQVGSDVPFFASGAASALARGRGELLESCPLTASLWVVLAWPGVALGTAAVYARYRPGEGASERVRELAAAPFATSSSAGLAALVENDLEAPAAELCPPTAALRVQLLGAGALSAGMSGSGSAVYGIFAAESDARAAHERLAASAPWAAVAPLPRTDSGATIVA
jgi:4-diphosphocytidyl-2-C-methyl-D-erythritol kinase